MRASSFSTFCARLFGVLGVGVVAFLAKGCTDWFALGFRV